MTCFRLLSVAVLMAACADGAQAQTIASVGGEFTSGKYGAAQRIDVATASAGLRAKRKRVTGFATVPFVRTRGPGNVVAPTGPLGLPVLVDPTRPATRATRSGIGDVGVGASVQLLQPRTGKLALAVTGGAKLPTASTAKALGTGKTDVSIAADAAIPGRITPFVGVGYTAVGQPDAYRLRNVTSARGGAALRLGETSEVALSYSYASRIGDGVADRQEVGLGAQTGLSKRLTLGVQGSAGLTSGAPAAAGGLRLGLRL